MGRATSAQLLQCCGLDTDDTLNTATTELALTLACSLILSRLDYCNAVLHGSIQKLQHTSFSKCQDDHLLCHSWNNFTGFPFVNELTTNLQFSHIKHAVHPHRHTLTVISDLGNLLISAHPMRSYCTSQSPEPASPIVLSVAQHPLFGTLWLLTLQPAVH